MFVPPEQRQPWYPPQPEREKSRRSENVLLFLIGIFLLSMLLAPIGGSTVLQAFLAVLPR